MLLYIWNPEKWHWLSDFQGRKRDTDREHVCGHNRGGEGKLNWDNSIETQYITMCKILTDSWWKDAVWHRKLTPCCVTTWRSGMGCVVGDSRGRDICTLLVNSHNCTTHCKDIILQLKLNLKNNIYIYQIPTLYTLNIIQFDLPVLSQTIFCFLVMIHDIWFIYVVVYIGKKKKKKNSFAVSTEKGKMETFLMLKYHLSKRINN